MQLITKSLVIMVTSRSRNIVLLDLAEDGDFDRLVEQQHQLMVKTLEKEALEQQL
jgi:hypothetical protein